MLIARSLKVIRSAPLPIALALAWLSGGPALGAADPASEEAVAAQSQPDKRIAQMVTIRPKPGMEAVLADRIQGLADPTRHENGNLRYDLFQQDGGTWLVFEYWADEAALAAHMAAPYSAAFLKDMSQFVDGNPEITVFRSVNVAR